jgi:hypothetical protein
MGDGFGSQLLLETDFLEIFDPAFADPEYKLTIVVPRLVNKLNVMRRTTQRIDAPLYTRAASQQNRCVASREETIAPGLPYPSSWSEQFADIEMRWPVAFHRRRKVPAVSVSRAHEGAITNSSTELNITLITVASRGERSP